MKSFTAVATAAALFSTVYGATVTIEETPCIQGNTELKSFEVEIGTLKVGQLESVCGLKIVSAEGANVDMVMCQAFKDAEGKVDGSATFTKAKPAMIATNPVQEGSIQCSLFGDNSDPSQTTLSTTGVAPTGTPTGTGYGTAPQPTGGNSTSPGGAAPSPSPTGPLENTNAAGRLGLSLGALALGVAAFML